MTQSDYARLQLHPQSGGCLNTKPNRDGPGKWREGKASVASDGSLGPSTILDKEKRVRLVLREPGLCR